jgi:hypothetical protein
MLDGIAANEIIVGAYANRDGVCPMLAAHRAGGRTNLIAFAKAWDRFAFRDVRAARARRASERELLALRVHLEASLLAEDAPLEDLAAARREHLELVARRERHRPTPTPRERPGPSEARAGRARPGDPDRSRELADRPGWAWTRVMRRYDEYERVLCRLQSERLATDPGQGDPNREPALTA